MAEIVLDTSALLAFVNGELGGDKVAAVISNAAISTVNLAEAITKLVERGATTEVARDALAIANYSVVDFDRRQAEEAGALVARPRGRALSLGDRACLALAQREGLPVLTGDRIWAELISDIEIRLFR